MKDVYVVFKKRGEHEQLITHRVDEIQRGLDYGAAFYKIMNLNAQDSQTKSRYGAIGSYSFATEADFDEYQAEHQINNIQSTEEIIVEERQLSFFN